MNEVASVAVRIISLCGLERRLVLVTFRVFGLFE